MERSLMLRNVHDLGANRGDIVHEATITCPACGSRRGLRLRLGRGVRKHRPVGAANGSVAEYHHIAGLNRRWLLINGREQHEPDGHRRERNPEGRTERDPEGGKRDVSLPRSLVGNGEIGAVRMSGRRHDLGIGATGLPNSPRLGGYAEERRRPYADDRPRDGEATSSRYCFWRAPAATRRCCSRWASAQVA